MTRDHSSRYECVIVHVATVSYFLQSVRYSLQPFVLLMNKYLFASRTHEVVQFAFCSHDIFERAETFEVCLPDVRNQAVIWLHKLCQRTYFARMIRAHLNHGHIMFVRKAKQGQRHTDRIVVIPERMKRLVFFRKYRGE